MFHSFNGGQWALLCSWVITIDYIKKGFWVFKADKDQLKCLVQKIIRQRFRQR